MDGPRPGAPGERQYGPRGGARALFYCRDPEVLLAGPAGTGKSRAALEKLNLLALKYPGFRGLIVRKTRESLQQSALVTFETEVLVPTQARFYSGKSEWRYRNGSVIVAGGLDKVSKIMSSEYDLIYVQEATEISEDEWEHLTTRLRRAATKYRQIIGCCNPAGPNHWLKKRAEAGRLTLISSAHEENPILYDEKTSSYTEAGTAYLAKLDALTGVRHQRLRLGQWVAAEGMVYEDFDWNLHVIEHDAPPKHWPRYWAIDFGYTHPFCFQAWAKDEDDRLYRFAELYRTGMLVEEAALRIKEWMRRKGEDFPQAILCDHDAEGRATLEKHLGVATMAANKSVSPGLQAVMKRLRIAEDGKPRLFLMKDSALARDPKLLESKQPSATEEEFELYLWQEGIKDSVPVKRDDHGLDALRYLCLYLDRPVSTSSRVFPEFSASVHVREGRSYYGGPLVVGLALGVGTTAMSVHEIRKLPEGEREIATLGAIELEAATAEVIARVLEGWKSYCENFRIFAEPDGDSGQPATGVRGALLRLGVRVSSPEALKDLPGRIHTVRMLLQGKDPYGKPVRYVCADASPGLLRFIECLERASWPTDSEGEVQIHPTSLASNRYVQHANAFSCAMEGYLRMTEGGLPPSCGGLPNRFGLPSDGRPMTAGLLQKEF